MDNKDYTFMFTRLNLMSFMHIHTWYIHSYIQVRMKMFYGWWSIDMYIYRWFNQCQLMYTEMYTSTRLDQCSITNIVLLKTLCIKIIRKKCNVPFVKEAETNIMLGYHGFSPWNAQQSCIYLDATLASIVW